MIDNVSIVTPVLNNANTIRDCIESVRKQSHECQHVIVDGCSSDGTLQIAERMADRKTIVVSEPDQGIYDAINKGIQASTGTIIGVLNADDFYPEENVIEKVMEALSNREAGACYGDLVYVDREQCSRVTRLWKSGELNTNSFYNGWMPPHPTFFIRADLYRRYGNYRLDLGTSADYELMLRMLLKHKVCAAYIPEILVHMRNRGVSNRDFLSRLRANRHDRLAWTVNDLTPKPWTSIAKPLRKLPQWWRKAERL